MKTQSLMTSYVEHALMQATLLKRDFLNLSCLSHHQFEILWDDTKMKGIKTSINYCIKVYSFYSFYVETAQVSSRGAEGTSAGSAGGCTERGGHESLD